MKKLLYSLLALTPALFCACNEDQGSEPGTDPEPRVSIFSYAPEDYTVNPDNAVSIRLATNNATKEIAYLVEKSADVEAFLSPYEQKNQRAIGEAAYAQKVLAEGQRIKVDGAQTVDFDLKDLHGVYTISAVAEGSSHRSFIEFTGLEWKKVVSGTFMFRQSFMPQAKICDLEVCTTDPTVYRLKDLFGAGNYLKLNMVGARTVDPDGDIYDLMRITPQYTGQSLTLKAGEFPMFVEDVGYWQGNSIFVTNTDADYAAYHNRMYKDGTMLLNIVWCVLRNGAISAASFNVQNYSLFIPDQTPAN